jgi:phosphate:Na+ symporter
MQNAAAIAGEVAGKSAAPDRTASIETRRKSAGSPEVGVAVDAPAALIRLEQSAKALGELRLAHRSATLSAVATGALTADEAIVRVDAVTRFEALACHAWRSAAHLVGRGE